MCDVLPDESGIVLTSRELEGKYNMHMINNQNHFRHPELDSGSQMLNQVQHDGAKSEFSEWEEKKLEDVFKIGSGKDYKHLESGDIPVYGTGGYMLSVSDYLYEGESVCIGRKGTIDKPMFLDGKFWTVDTLFYTHSFKDSIPKFIFYIFQTINWQLYNEAKNFKKALLQQMFV